MKTKEPDIILRAAHALPDQVAEMFAEDFKTNDIWKHFQAVKDGKVYAVLDVDSPFENRFTAEDEAFLEKIAALLAEKF